MVVFFRKGEGVRITGKTCGFPGPEKKSGEDVESVDSRNSMGKMGGGVPNLNQSTKQIKTKGFTMVLLCWAYNISIDLLFE